MPTGWSWRATTVVVLTLLHPYLLVLALPESTTARFYAAGSMTLLLVQLATLAAAAMLTYEWRVSHRPVTGWLAMALAVSAAQHVPLGLLAVQGAAGGSDGYLVGVTQLPLLALLLGLVAAATRSGAGPAWNPLATGLALGAVAGAIRFVAVHQGVDPAPHLAAPVRTAVVLTAAALVTAMVALLVTTTALPAWARVRLVGYLALLVAGQVLAAPLVGTSMSGPPPASAFAAVVGAALLCATTATLLRETLRDNSQRLSDLASRAAAAEVSVRHGQERMHELHATVAGIAQASRLLLTDGGPRGSQRRRLQTMIDSETRRLERMLTHRGSQPVDALSVAEVLRPLVESRRALGAVVHLDDAGLRALGRPDDLAEVLHILLTNAARHAPGAPVSISTRRVDGVVEIQVSDAGPGVAPDVRDALFAWGARSAGSPGQGIGLQLARRLMVEQAGDLRLVHEGRSGGATFVITLPECPPGWS